MDCKVNGNLYLLCVSFVQMLLFLICLFAIVLLHIKIWRFVVPGVWNVILPCQILLLTASVVTFQLTSTCLVAVTLF